MYYVILISIIFILLVLLIFKKEKDYKEETQLQVELLEKINQLRNKASLLNEALEQKTDELQKTEKERFKILEDSKKLKDELEHDYELLIAAKRRLYQEETHRLEVESELEKDVIIAQYCDYCDYLKKQETEIEDQIDDKKQILTSILEPIKRLQQIEQEKKFYSLTLTDVEQEDISYLTTTVAPRINNKDVIPKLIWSEYIQKPTQDMTKRLEISDSPGIYKITNIKNNKCYIGKSTKVRQRLIDHIKGALGISSISDQLIHHEMLREGIENWTFECICYCDKEHLGEKEKYYINFFDSQNYGYNIKSGG